MRVTLPLLCYHSLCISPEFFLLPLHLPLIPTPPAFFLFGEVVCGTIPLVVVRCQDGPWMGGLPPSLITHEEPSTYQPGSN
jgi:hypothetical protein